MNAIMGLHIGIRVSHVEDFPQLLLHTQIYVQQGPTFTENVPSSSQLGGKHKFGHFYPQIDYWWGHFQ